MLRRDFLFATSVVAASAAGLGGAAGIDTTARRLWVFNSVSLDGYFTDGTPDMSWAHPRDEEWQRFTSENAGARSAHHGQRRNRCSVDAGRTD
jgi:hypothetical protein